MNKIANELTNEALVNVLELAKKRIINRYSTCLCGAINEAMYKLFPKAEYSALIEILPSFTHKNALMFGAREDPSYVYWWKLSEVKLRVEFLDWMINLHKPIILNGNINN